MQTAWRALLATIVLSLFSAPAQAQSIGTIKKIDLSDERPPDPTYILIEFKPKKIHFLGHVILRQFSKRVRIEFEGDGLPNGTYLLAAASACPPPGPLSADRYKSVWTELHRLTWNTPHIYSEKSLPQASLRAGGGKPLVLEGKSLAVIRLRGGKYDLLDCASVH